MRFPRRSIGGNGFEQMDGAIPLGQPEAVRDLAHGSGLDDVALVLTAAVVVVVAVQGWLRTRTPSNEANRGEADEGQCE